MARDLDISGLQSRIAEARRLRRMSLDDVAKVSGLTKSHVWELEKGRSRNPTVRAVWSLARALTVSPSWLLGLSTETVSGDPLALEVAALIELRLQERATPTKGDQHG
ncbi:helix-turn-helix transcriptional regulator [Sphingopyxis sp. SCN 67-31]|uniref:helix-turn-helix domain-containing protein n=1 Tax=Sphingopyxis sp. SCN 67-31 TaxID=1660142 RepID=UPI00257AC655|nr:helix-turn-helix transcriptional regulator [Sphingopyxis sp. SCN 67-31]